MTKFINWAHRAEVAEAKGDYATAKECWYRAAEQSGVSDLRSYYNEREDRAEELRLKHISEK